MLNTSVNLEKEKAVCVIGVGWVMGIKWCCWLSKHATDLYPT